MPVALFPILYDVIAIGFALLLLVAFDPPRSGWEWLRAFIGAIVGGLAAGQAAAHMGWGRTARNLLVGAVAFFADGLVAVALRVRQGMADDPIAMLKSIVRLRSGQVDQIPDDLLKDKPARQSKPPADK